MKNTFSLLLLLSFYFVSNAQNSRETYTLQQLQTKFSPKNYSEKVLLEFQKTMMDLREKPQLHEEVPGEVISWFTLNGRFSMHSTYLIQNNTLQAVETIPKDDAFLKQLNSYVPEKSRFSYWSDLWSFGFVTGKLDDGFYLIKASAKSFNSHPDIPNDDILLYDLEYKTKDFKRFQLVRLKDSHLEEWVEVGS